MSNIYEIASKKCLICNKGQKNDTLYWHIDPDDSSIWCWCNKCDRGYSIQHYARDAGLLLNEFLSQGKFDFKESTPNEVTKMGWPRTFVPLFSEKARSGVEYVKSRGIDIDDGMYYDTERQGIVFPYYYDNVFCGAQIRFIAPWTDENGDERKIDTLPGTRLGLLFYNWNQTPMLPSIKGIIVTEGAFNALAIQQALNYIYGGITSNPWRCIACSGSGASKHHTETIQELKDIGKKIVIAPDSDEAGMKMLAKFAEAGAATHYAITGDDAKDWNDFAKEMGKEEFAKWFLGRIKNVG